MQDTTKKKHGAVASATVILLLLLSYLALVLYIIYAIGFQTAAVIVLVIYGLVIVIAIWCILYAMHQRLKELESGEEEEAKKY